jgi:hypothetical protein
VETDCSDGVDNDCDGLADCLDTDCCGSAECAPPDWDKDGFQGCGDCNPSNPDFWTAPGEVRDVIAVDKTRFGWTVPLDPGSNDPVVYELLRSGVPSDFLAHADCLSPSPATATSIVDNTIPPSGQMLAYLVRGTNDCPAGVGTLGSGAFGERVGRSCP